VTSSLTFDCETDRGASAIFRELCSATKISFGSRMAISFGNIIRKVKNPVTVRAEELKGSGEADYHIAESQKSSRNPTGTFQIMTVTTWLPNGRNDGSKEDQKSQ